MFLGGVGGGHTVPLGGGRGGGTSFPKSLVELSRKFGETSEFAYISFGGSGKILCLKPVMQIFELSCLEISGLRILLVVTFSGNDESCRSIIFDWHLYLNESGKKN